MSNPQSDQQLQAILNQIGKFGFNFYAYDESGIPLLKGPNNQIVNINLAIQFVNKQIKQASQSSSGSLENPQFNESVDSAASPETSVETKIESASESQESAKKKEEANNQATPDLVVKQQSPKIKIQQASTKPYQDGFDPKSFDPSSIASTLNFVEKNSKKSAKSSNKWLAEQFKKFVEEFKASVESS